MIFCYDIDSLRHRATVELSGSVHGSDIAETLRALYCDPRWRPGFDTVWDASGTTELFIDMNDLAYLARLHIEYKEISGGGRDVILAVRAVDIAMAQIYAFHAKGGPRRAYIVSRESELAQVLDTTRAQNDSTCLTEKTSYES